MKSVNSLWPVLVVSGLSAGCAPGPFLRETQQVQLLSREAPLWPGPDADSSTGKRVEELLAQPLTADGAVEVSLLNNRTLRAALHSVRSAQGRAQQQALPPNPELEVVLREGGEGGPGVEVTVEYELTHALLVPLRADAARFQTDAQRVNAAAAVVRHAFQVRAATIALGASERKLALAHQLLDSTAAGQEAAAAIFRAGNASELELATRDAALETARAELTRADVDRVRSRLALANLLGLDRLPEAWVAGPALDRVAEPEDPGLEARAVESSLELEQRRLKLEQLSRIARLHRVEGWVPAVTVGVQAERDGPRWGAGAVVKLGLPLIDRSQGKIAAAVADQHAEQARLEAEQLEIRSGARALHAQLRACSAVARRFEEGILPARRNVFRQALLQYNAMQLGIFALLQAQRELFTTESAYVDALQGYWTARAAARALAAGVRVDAGREAGPANTSTNEQGEH